MIGRESEKKTDRVGEEGVKEGDCGREEGGEIDGDVDREIFVCLFIFSNVRWSVQSR